MEGRTIRETIAERRLEARVARHLAIRYKPLEDLLHHSSWRDGSLLDLSGGGLSFVATEQLVQGSQLVIALNFVGWCELAGEWTATGSSADVGILRAVGQVIWVAPGHDEAGQWETGVRFAGTMNA